MSKEGCNGRRSLLLNKIPAKESAFTNFEVNNWLRCFRRPIKRDGSVGREAGADLQLPFLQSQLGVGKSSNPFFDRSLECPLRIAAECFK